MVQLWDPVMGLTQQTFRDHTGLIRALAVSLDGKEVVSASDDGTIQLWDAKTDEILRELKGNANKMKRVNLIIEITKKSCLTNYKSNHMRGQ